MIIALYLSMMNLQEEKTLCYCLCEIKHIFCLSTDEAGCSYCGGLGHRITDCPKLEAIQSKASQNIGRKDYLASNAADW